MRVEPVRLVSAAERDLPRRPSLPEQAAMHPAKTARDAVLSNIYQVSPLFAYIIQAVL